MGWLVFAASVLFLFLCAANSRVRFAALFIARLVK